MADDSAMNDGADTGSSDSSSSTTQQTKQLLHKIYKYKVDAFELFFPDIPQPVKLEPGSITSMYIYLDYDNCFFPILSLDCAMNPRLIEYVKVRKGELQVRLRFQVVTMNAQGDIEGSEDVFNQMFIAMIPGEEPFYDYSIYAETAEKVENMASDGQTANDLGGNNLTADMRESFKFSLYVQRDLTNSKNVINDVYSGNDLATILVSMLGDNGFDAILMSPCENGDDFDQVLIEPMNLINVFNYLAENYGLYASGVTAFFDYRCLYILNKSGHPNCVEEGEYPKTIFSIHETKYAESILPGTLECPENKEYHIYPDPHRVHPVNGSMYNDQINGNNLMLINSKTNSTSTIKGTGDQIGDGSTRIDNNQYGTDYTKLQYANSISENNFRVKVTFMDALMYAITPNKEFIFDWLDNRYYSSRSGYYRPCTVVHAFRKDGDFMTITTDAIFTKKEDLSAAEKESIDNLVQPPYDTTLKTTTAPTTKDGPVDTTTEGKTE